MAITWKFRIFVERGAHNMDECICGNAIVHDIEPGVTIN